MSEPVQIADSDEELLHAAVREAGALAATYFAGSANSWTKDDGTPVSDADLAIDELLKERLHGARPGYGWLSEETKDTPDRLTYSRVWVIDPIDGTRAFLEGTEHWCIVAALVEHGRPVLGAVYLPLGDRMYAARLGAGAWLNGRRLAVSQRRELAGSRVIAHQGILRPERWRRPWPSLNVSMTTALALRLCLVADGSYDAAVAIGEKSDWDLAAGDLIVHEAGGQVSDLDGGRLTYNRRKPRQAGLVACGTSLHDEVIHHTTGFRRH